MFYRLSLIRFLAAEGIKHNICNVLFNRTIQNVRVLRGKIIFKATKKKKIIIITLK